MAEKTPKANGAKKDKKEQEKTEDLEQVKVMAALAYIGILFFLPLVTHPESKFGKFHANQGLLLLITGVAINVVGSFIPILGWFIILPLGYIFTIILFVMGLVNALNKKMKRLPVIGGFDLIK